jgi:hypothetical protein
VPRRDTHDYVRGGGDNDAIHLKATGATTSAVDGRFVIKSGTGAYRGLRGTGKTRATLNTATGAITAVYTGRAHVSGA